jgi:nucleoside-diphosphate-sugar epimerase|tara:strand:+ start:1138 stop:2079 length:942 start_codon:yes stop_codon:yes gene_type:complete
LIKKKKILITGGAGYIGSMLSTKLLKEGCIVTVIDKLNYNPDSLNHLYLKNNFHFINADINKNNFLNKLNLYDIIIPLAGLVGAPLCEKNKRLAKETNFKHVKNIVKKMTQKQKIIYLNTNSGYGIGKKNEFCDEKSPLNPISLYGITKCQAEEEVKKFKNSVIFRLATVFGYSYRMRTDLLVNNFCYQAVNKKKLTLFEPHFRRNYIHVRDVVDAMIFSLKNFSKMRNNIYNLGLSSANLTKLQLAKEIKKTVKDLQIKIVDNKKDPDQRDYFVSNKKIEKKGFKPKYHLSHGIKEMVKIFSNSDSKYNNNY